MFHHSTNTASFFSAVMTTLIFSLFLVGAAAAQGNTRLGDFALQSNTLGSQNTASAQSGSTKEATLAGSWVVYVTPAPESGIPPFVNLQAFTKDGRTITSDPTDGAGVGEWIKTGPRQFAATFMGFTKVGEEFLLFKVRGTAEVNKSGDTFAGSFQTDIFDGEGNVVTTFTGTVRATRFGVEPLE